MTVAPTASGSRPRPEASAASLFELPVSSGARLARVFVVLALDLLLAGAGVAMIWAYLDARRVAAAEVAPAAADAGPVAEVEALPPQPIGVAERLPGGEAEPGEDAEPGGEAEAPRRARRPGRPATPSRDPAAQDRKPAAPDREPAAPDREPAEPEHEPEPSPEPEVGPAGEPEAGEPPPGLESDPEDVQRLAGRIGLLVDRHQGQLQRCYERAAKVMTPADPLEGRIEIAFAVTSAGRAENVRVARNDTNSQQLSDCLTGLVESWSFPAAAREPVDFLWPFVFKAPQ